MPLRLPPLPALRFFEAAGRHQSFKLAAAELNVTPSAISHGIVGLEQSLGVELFAREPRGISLTAAGADYLSYVSEAFSLIEIGTQRLPNHRANRPIALSCAPTLASRWLLPRLGSLRAAHPALDVRVLTTQAALDPRREPVDLAVDVRDAAVEPLLVQVGEHDGHLQPPREQQRELPGRAPLVVERELLVALSCVDGNGTPITPCGRCRQLLFEHASPDMLIDAVFKIREQIQHWPLLGHMAEVEKTKEKNALEAPATIEMKGLMR